MPLYHAVRYATIWGMYVSVGLTVAARDALRASTLAATTPVGRKLAMSEVLLAALAVADAHPDELLERIQVSREG